MLATHTYLRIIINTTYLKSMNSIWKFFSSVKLAITTLCILAFTSIFGTIIPQGNNFDWYVNYFSERGLVGFNISNDTGYKIALIIDILDIPDMYTSWWFLSLLAILSINLIVCSIDRFPLVLRQINTDNLSYSINKLLKMGNRRDWGSIPGTIPSTQDTLVNILKKNGWKSNLRQSEHTTIFCQKGPWSRTGVYVVHLSILVIFLGASVGSLLGFKGSVMIPETKQTDTIYSTADSSPIDLGFIIRCDSFVLDFYENGMPKTYKSALTILENDSAVMQKDIEVNRPLTYKGITFYQASYEEYQDFVLTIDNLSTNSTTKLLTPFQEKQTWTEEAVSFGVINAESFNNHLARIKIWFSNNKDEPVTFWTDPDTATTIKVGDTEYSIHVKQMYATGLQVAKDPGVWLVYLGCFLMLVGLYVAFFMSHKRIWVTLKKDGSTVKVVLYGTSNKNRIGFDATFDKLADKIDTALSKQ